MKIKKGDYVYWGWWKLGVVEEVLPKGNVFIYGLSDETGSFFAEFTRNINTPPRMQIVPISWPSYRLVRPDEVIRIADEIWTGEEWYSISNLLSSDHAPYCIRRKL